MPHPWAVWPASAGWDWGGCEVPSNPAPFYGYDGAVCHDVGVQELAPKLKTSVSCSSVLGM